MVGRLNPYFSHNSIFRCYGHFQSRWHLFQFILLYFYNSWIIAYFILKMVIVGLMKLKYQKILWNIKEILCLVNIWKIYHLLTLNKILQKKENCLDNWFIYIYIYLHKMIIMMPLYIFCFNDIGTAIN